MQLSYDMNIIIISPYRQNWGLTLKTEFNYWTKTLLNEKHDNLSFFVHLIAVWMIVDKVKGSHFSRKNNYNSLLFTN